MREKLRHVRDARLCKRLQAILAYDRGVLVGDIAELLNVSRQSVHNWIVRFREQKRVDSLYDAPHPGRPARADEAFDVVLGVLLILSPQWFGYHAMHWTVRLLCDQLRNSLGQDFSDDTVRRGLHRLGYVWKRPRYMLMPDPEQEKKTPNSTRPLWIVSAQRGVGGGRDRFAAVPAAARDVVQTR